MPATTQLERSLGNHARPYAVATWVRCKCLRYPLRGHTGLNAGMPAMPRTDPGPAHAAMAARTWCGRHGARRFLGISCLVAHFASAPICDIADRNKKKM